LTGACMYVKLRAEEHYPLLKHNITYEIVGTSNGLPFEMLDDNDIVFVRLDNGKRYSVYRMRLELAYKTVNYPKESV